MNSEFKERRKEERFTCDPPELFTATFNLRKGSGDEQIWELSVLDFSQHGLRLLVTDIDYDLVTILKPGDVLKNITFYGESTLIRVDATIKYIRQFGHGPYKGQHFIGLESSDIITGCIPPASSE